MSLLEEVDVGIRRKNLLSCSEVTRAEILKVLGSSSNPRRGGEEEASDRRTAKIHLA